MYKVLIVDDEPLILKGLRNIIKWEELGLEIIDEASNGIEALKVIENKIIHILITDIKMPKMDGLELIQAILDKNLYPKCIVLSGYDDFKLIKEAVKLGIENYLLKPVNVNELVSTLSNTMSKIENELYKQIEASKGLNILKNNIVIRWVNNDIGEYELLERASLLNINLNTKGFQIALVKILNTFSANSLHKIENINLLRFAVLNICSEVVSESTTGLSFCDLNGDIVIIFINDTLNYKKLFSGILDSLISKINQFLDINVFVTSGSYQKKFQDVHLSYFQAKKLQEYCFIIPPNNVILFEDVTSKNFSVQFDISENLKKLNEYIQSKNDEKAVGMIDIIYNQLIEMKELTPSHIQNLTIEVLLSVIDTMKGVKGNSEILFENYSDLFQNIFEKKTIDALKTWIKEMVLKCIDFLSSERDKLNPAVRQVLEYMQSNYVKDINLKCIASNFNISPAYLGYLFNKEIGDTFTNYLNMLRVEKAKELLINTSLKANEISEKVGYINTNYFPIIFKKLTGFSTSEFKKK